MFPHPAVARSPMPPATTDIQLQLSLDELNLVLEAVGNLPFARVFALVGKIQAQAGAQLQAQAGAAALPATAQAAGQAAGQAG
jgi:hypothetical protein